MEMCLSGLFLTSLWDRRSGTRGLGGPGGLKSSDSLQKMIDFDQFAVCY